MIPFLQTAFFMTVFAGASCLLALGLTNDPAAETAILLSALLATMNGLCALWLSYFGSKRPSLKGFFGAILGGMLLRMGTTLVGFVVGLKILLLPAVPFATALLAFTGLFIAAEVALWSRQTFPPRVELS